MQKQSSNTPLSISAPVQKDLISYIDHTVRGQSIRAVARASGVHPSTILRRVRKLENRREDPLVDEAIEHFSMPKPTSQTEDSMQISTTSDDQILGFISFLSCLSDEDTFLALAPDMENAVIMRQTDEGRIEQRQIVGRADAQNMALNEWIEPIQAGRISKYVITKSGRQARAKLQHMLDDPDGFSESQAMFGQKPQAWQHKIEIRSDGLKVHRPTAADSPIALLSRRKGKDGKPFLESDLVEVGERLRQDFELSQMGPSITQNWDTFLTGPQKSFDNSSGLGDGAKKAANRFQAAMQALGPGLSEIAMHCCCHQRGVEQAEKKMGWSARSGKIVLRIALQRLKLHYEETHGPLGPMIG